MMVRSGFAVEAHIRVTLKFGILMPLKPFLLTERLDSIYVCSILTTSSPPMTVQTDYFPTQVEHLYS